MYNIVSVVLFLLGIHRRVIAPSIVTQRARSVLGDFNMSCDDTGKLILKPTRPPHLHETWRISSLVILQRFYSDIEMLGRVQTIFFQARYIIVIVWLRYQQKFFINLLEKIMSDLNKVLLYLSL